MFEKRIKGGVKRKHTLGHYPTISLAKARELALALEAEATLGIDRVAEKAREEKERALEFQREKSVGEVLNRYSKQKLASLKSGAERIRQLNACLDGLMDLPMNQLELEHLIEPIEEKIDEGKYTMSNRVRAALKAFTRWAFERNLIEVDVGARLPRALPERPRERTPSVQEVRAIWAATYQLGDLWGPLVRLLVLTGQRRGEISRLRWKEVNLSGEFIAKVGADTKNGQPHKTHLSPPALTELNALAVKGSGDFVFTTTGKTPISGLSKAKRHLDRLLGDDFEPWVYHDLRRAVASALCDRGFSEVVVDRILNHQAVGSAPSAVSRVYNTAQLLPERAAALDAWAEVVTGTQDAVVELRRYQWG